MCDRVEAAFPDQTMNAVEAPTTIHHRTFENDSTATFVDPLLVILKRVSIDNKHVLDDDSQTKT